MRLEPCRPRDFQHLGLMVRDAPAALLIMRVEDERLPLSPYFLGIDVFTIGGGSSQR